jgi:hypothetical protein
MMRPADGKGWVRLLTFTLNTQLDTGDPGRYLVRSNDPEWSL